MESALLQNSPFTITDDQFDPNDVDLLADAIISNSLQRASKTRRSTMGDDKRKFDQVDGAIKSANPLKTTRELMPPTVRLSQCTTDVLNWRHFFLSSLILRYKP